MSSPPSSSSDPPLPPEAWMFISVIIVVVLYLIVKECINFCKGNPNPQPNATVQPDIETGHPPQETQPPVNHNIRPQARRSRISEWIESLRIAQQSGSVTKKRREPCDECGICLEDWQEGESINTKWVLPKCKHVFHRKCICDWVKSSGKTCPICRTVFVDFGGDNYDT